MARRHARRNGLDEDTRNDLEHFAYEGLLEAIDRYDPHRQASFLSFATARIAGSIVDGLARLREINAQLRFRQRIERERMDSLADTGKDGQSATHQLAELITELALGLILEEEERRTPSELIGRSDHGFKSLAWRETRLLLLQRVAELPELERSVIRQHYLHDLLFAQIAQMLNLSRGRVSQLHKSALTKLRKSIRILR